MKKFILKIFSLMVIFTIVLSTSSIAYGVDHIDHPEDSVATPMYEIWDDNDKRD